MNGSKRYHHVAFATLAVVTLLTATVRDLSAAPKVVEMLIATMAERWHFLNLCCTLAWVNKCILKQRIPPTV